MSDSKIKNTNRWIILIGVLALLTIICIVFYYFHLVTSSLPDTHEGLGPVGDFFGGTLNPLLSFLALLALLHTISIQSKELEATRKELQRSALAQEKTESNLEAQSSIFIRQQFEQTFFALLEQHNTALDRISTSTRLSQSSKLDLDVVKDYVFKASEINLGKERLQEYDAYLGHYFRVLYQLLKFIATNCPENKVKFESFKDDIKNLKVTKEEKMYSNIVRSFLGYDISQLLAINCYCQDDNSGYYNYKLLLERYEFLEHMPFTINQQDSRILIESKDYYAHAFGKSDFII